MKRRELIAGMGSVSVLGSAGVLFRYGLPSIGDEESAESNGGDGNDTSPLTIETIDARGSQAGSLTVPSDNVMVIMFFVTGCGNCQAQMPRLNEAQAQLHEEYGDAVTVLSVTYQSLERMPADKLSDWWAAHNGNWYVGYDSGLAQTYNVVGYPVTMVVDPDGTKRWAKNGIVSAESIIAAAKPVLEGATANAGGNKSPRDEERNGNESKQ